MPHILFAFFRIVGYTKSGAPKLRELEATSVSEYSTPIDSMTVKRLDLQNLREIGSIRNARWSKKSEKWTIRIDKGKSGVAELETHVPSNEFSEPTYG